MEDVEHARELLAAGAERSRQLLGLVGNLDRAALEAPSELPGWTRLTIVCHLRYGTHALLRMTRDALAGRPTSYYSEGRAAQRPGTLRPAPGESPARVVVDWADGAERLDDLWATLADEDWSTTVVEPPGSPDLGEVPLARLSLARLTELDVHGTDLDIGAPDWSSSLVRIGLPTRLRWLSTRRTNHRPFDASIQGSWILDAHDGPRWFVEVARAGVTSRPALDTDDAAATISASSRDLLALLLGRRCTAEPILGGDAELARSFPSAFPGP
ncbi:MAG TPA: maleylpyruvate isomerase N-terminal domain-containing protein [Acidimicrobiales bacterium]|nr:maleylpyruvate isomerase N-terminal domain-containing protein [Acidimicrobiales bacterium]